MKVFKIKKILVPIDFSDLSLNALRHAEKLAQKAKASLLLLHVVELHQDAFGTSGMLATVARWEKSTLALRSKKLARIAQLSLKRTTIPVKSKAAIGNISYLIRKTASEEKADMILMGTHGTSGFVESLLGSNTYKVATLSDIPVLSVYKRASTTQYHQIIYIVRDHIRAMKKFPYVLAFAQMFKAQVHLLGYYYSAHAKYTQRIQSTCMTIKKKFKRKGIESQVYLAADKEFVEATIQYAIKHTHALVVIMQEHDFHLVELFRRSYLKEVLQKAVIPILTIPSS